MTNDYQEEKSTTMFWNSHLLAEAAQRAKPGSATRRGLWNAFAKKALAAEAQNQIEDEREVSKTQKGGEE